MADEPLSHTVTELARKLGSSRTFIYHLIEDGYLETYAGRGVTRVTTESWQRYLASTRTGKQAVKQGAP